MIDIKTTKAATESLGILYVEDEQGIREQLRMLLGTLFMDVLVAFDGKMGLDRYKEHQSSIDLVITDIKMPEMSGLEIKE